MYPESDLNGFAGMADEDLRQGDETLPLLLFMCLYGIQRGHLDIQDAPEICRRVVKAWEALKNG